MSPGVRSAVRWAAKSKPFEAFVSAVERLEPTGNYLRVLTYHRVDLLDARPELAPCTLSATPDSFARQMEFLAENYSVLSINELIELRRSGARLPLRSVIVTFDDAYQDFSQYAWPILQRYDLPATLFVPTAYPEDSSLRFWWDRLHQAIMEAEAATYELQSWGPFTLGEHGQRQMIYRQLLDYIESLEHESASDLVDNVCETLALRKNFGAVLGWNELRALASPKLTLAPHTRTHPLLNRVTKIQARKEILDSVDDLRREIGEPPRVFSYPGGGLTSEVVELLREEEFELAFTTGRGIVDWSRADPLRLPRINVGYRCPFGLWRGQLVGMARYLMPN